MIKTDKTNSDVDSNTDDTAHSIRPHEAANFHLESIFSARTPLSVQALRAITRVETVLDRIQQRYGEAAKKEPDGRPARTLQKAEQAFADYCKAWHLRVAGHSIESIAPQLGRNSVQAWFSSGAIPNELLRSDPEFRKQKQLPVSIPQTESTEFAYCIGAYLATAKKSTSALRGTITFQHETEIAVATLKQALLTACEISTSDKHIGKNQAVVVSRSSLVEYLHSVTSSSSRVPREHVITSAEKLRFLEGFFTFAGGTVLTASPRFQVMRQHNESLMKEVAVLLKQCGVLANVTGGKYSSIIINDQNEIQKFKALNVISAGKRKLKLDAIPPDSGRTRSFSVEDYKLVRKIGSELGFPDNATAYRVYVTVNEQNSHNRFELETVRRFLEGHEPVSVTRLKKLERYETELFEQRDFERISSALHERFKASGYRMSAVIQLLADCVDGIDSLSQKSRIPAQRITEYISGVRNPYADELATLLKAAHSNGSEALHTAQHSAEQAMIKSNAWDQRIAGYKVFLTPLLEKELEQEFGRSIPKRIKSDKDFILTCMAIEFEQTATNRSQAALAEARSIIRVLAKEPLSQSK